MTLGDEVLKEQNMMLISIDEYRRYQAFLLALGKAERSIATLSKRLDTCQDRLAAEQAFRRKIGKLLIEERGL